MKMYKNVSLMFLSIIISIVLVFIFLLFLSFSACDTSQLFKVSFRTYGSFLEVKCHKDVIKNIKILIVVAEVLVLQKYFIIMYT